MRILFTGGGTGGHIFPIIAIKQAFEQKYGFHYPDVPAWHLFLYRPGFYYLGPDKFAGKNLTDKGFKTRFILAGKLRRYFNLNIIFDLFKIIIGIIQSFWYLFLWVPDVIFSKGGYGSFPVVLVGWIYRIPIVLHESDSRPGLANRVLARFAKKIILSFSGSEKYFAKYQQKLILIGNPVRKEITQGNKEKGRKIFKISSTPSSDGAGKPVILIMGGSQGAQRINEIVLNTLPRLLELAEIIHISGSKNFKYVKKQAKSLLKFNFNRRYHLYPFLEVDNLKHAYATSDLIVNRAGAGSIFEIAACAKPSIIIPLPKSASNHQKKNAYEFAKNGAAIVLTQENLTPGLFLETISNLISNPPKLKEMGEKAKSFYNPKTPELIRDEILRLTPK